MDKKTVKVHAMWDAYVLNSKHNGTSPMQLAEEFDILTAEQIAKVQNSTPDDWHNETVEVSKKVIEMLPESKKITYDNYLNEAIKYAEDRITVAGYRLAAILNSIFDK
jgi:RPA family protein